MWLYGIVVALIWSPAISYNPLPVFGGITVKFGGDIPWASIDCSELRQEEINSLLKQDIPFVLRNPFVRNINNGEWIEEALRKLGNEMVQYDNQLCSYGGASDRIDSYECTLRQYFKMFRDNSFHEDAVYLMSETLLSSHDELSSQFKLKPSLFGEDGFLEFPSALRPHQALVASGMGARSFLHRDPFSWIGWNYLLSGRKIWLFLASSTKDDQVEANSTRAEAWSSSGVSLGVGALSPFDLFRHAHSCLHMLPDSTSVELPTGETVAAQYIVQEPGDLVVIPPDRWHQVYTASAAVAVAGQLLHPLNRARVCRHLVQHNSLLHLPAHEASALRAHPDKLSIAELLRLVVGRDIN